MMQTEQLLLFAACAEPESVPEARPVSHRADPQTSREAAERLRESGRLAAQQRAVLEALRQCDGDLGCPLWSVRPYRSAGSGQEGQFTGAEAPQRPGSE
jgi:hypothetical protein